MIFAQNLHPEVLWQVRIIWSGTGLGQGIGLFIGHRCSLRSQGSKPSVLAQIASLRGISAPSGRDSLGGCFTASKP